MCSSGDFFFLSFISGVVNQSEKNNSRQSSSHGVKPAIPSSQEPVREKESEPATTPRGPLGDLPPLTGPQRGSNLPPLSGPGKMQPIQMGQFV